MSPTGRVYVGSATPSSGHGITMFALATDRQGPRLDARGHVAGIDNPTFLASHPNGHVVYAVSETAAGGIVVIRVVGDELEVGQRVPSGGDGPCHLSTDGRRLAVANYGSGSAAAYALDADGRIAEPIWAVQHRGSGPHPRQRGPHAHCAAFDPRRDAVYVVDLGTDQVVRYDADETGFHRGAELDVAPGAGPRHVAFHPRDSIAFVICELDNTVVVLDTGASDPIVRDTVPTLPDDETVESLAAAVVVHPSGDRVFASNRGHDSIAVFAYDRGTLTPLGHVASGGAGPRDITVDPSGSLLLAANQHSGHVTAFDVTRSGLPRSLGVLARVADPTCVVVGATR